MDDSDLELMVNVYESKQRDPIEVIKMKYVDYIRNLVDLLPTSITMPQTNLLTGKALPKQVELASKAVCVIIVNDN